MMADLYDQCAAAKFCFPLKQNATETIVMLQTAYKEVALSKRQVYEWSHCSKQGEMSIDDPCLSRASSEQPN